MKAEVWEITVTGSALEWVHGSRTNIKELFIPEIGAAFNTGDNSSSTDKIYCFSTDSSRYGDGTQCNKIGEIELAEDFTDAINDYILAKLNLRRHAKWFDENVVNASDLVKD